MKKVFIYMFAALMVVAASFVSCKKQKAPAVAAEQNYGFVERTISMDKEYMYLNYGGDYRFYESCIKLVDFLDEECDGSVAGVANVFQAIVYDDGTSFDTEVVSIAHKGDAASAESKHGFWIEDDPILDGDIVLTYQDAFQRIQEVNYPKPHSQNCIIRKPLGPKDCNAQYVFGNLREQLWVDAVTGEVRTSNPAFEGFNMGTPLGEWP